MNTHQPSMAGLKTKSPSASLDGCCHQRQAQAITTGNEPKNATINDVNSCNLDGQSCQTHR
ncbi:hypothetical protein [Moraxella sp.]|uniref:hypothetical protein n=1 Tax=Moraxella sp. TaxID=479 RepID=UPI0026DB70B8|nr:hypothetical protein [Moraxella sp.]MDO4894186.1 hypothetical protein [Moraxella sp.]